MSSTGSARTRRLSPSVRCRTRPACPVPRRRRLRHTRAGTGRAGRRRIANGHRAPAGYGVRPEPRPRNGCRPRPETRPRNRPPSGPRTQGGTESGQSRAPITAPRPHNGHRARPERRGAAGFTDGGSDVSPVGRGRNSPWCGGGRPPGRTRTAARTSHQWPVGSRAQGRSRPEPPPRPSWDPPSRDEPPAPGHTRPARPRRARGRAAPRSAPACLSSEPPHTHSWRTQSYPPHARRAAQPSERCRCAYTFRASRTNSAAPAPCWS